MDGDIASGAESWLNAILNGGGLFGWPLEMVALAILLPVFVGMLAFNLLQNRGDIRRRAVAAGPEFPSEQKRPRRRARRSTSSSPSSSRMSSTAPRARPPAR